MDKNLELKQSGGQPFELVLLTRDASGNPTGKKSYSTDDPYKLSQFLLRNTGKPKKKVTPPIDKKLPVKKYDNLAAYVDNTEREVSDTDMQTWNEDGENK